MAKGGYRGRPMMGGGMNMNMVKQAQKMQQDMLKMQEELEVCLLYTSAPGQQSVWPLPLPWRKDAIVLRCAGEGRGG